MPFPSTKYMGSKQAILPFIIENLSDLQFETALDAFSGSACVAYALKQTGKRVMTNDFLKFAFHLAKATVENNTTTIQRDDVKNLLRPNKHAGTFIQEKYADIYFPIDDCAFLDNTYANIVEIESPLKRSLALSALCRAAMKKRPRGIFTFVGKKGWDGRADLRLSMREQFTNAIQTLNGAVFSNGKRNRAFCRDVFEIDPSDFDLVYFDPPYISPHSDCDYTRRYHFVEGLCTYWNGVEIQEGTLTKKFKSYSTPFMSSNGISGVFDRLFYHFHKSIIVVSYGSNGIPSRDEMVKLLRRYKDRVIVYSKGHTYSFGNHGHKVNNINNRVLEYLFIAS